jgi:predicted Holliday junction resolvase-like endonuclease
MKPPQYFITLTLASISLVLSIVVIWQGQSGISLQNLVQQKQIELQTEVQKRQEEVNRGIQSQQIGTNLLKDIAAASYDATKGTVRNEKLKDLLTKNGITVNVNQPTSSPTPAK